MKNAKRRGMKKRRGVMKRRERDEDEEGRGMRKRRAM